MTVNAITSVIGALIVHNLSVTYQTCIRNVKQGNKLLMVPPASCQLGLIHAVTTCAMFVRHTLQYPVTEEVAFVAGRGLQTFHI